MVSIAGGEPLMHPQIDEIVRRAARQRKKIVFLCTNAVLLPKHLHKFTPHRNFAWMVHIDGLRGPPRRVGLQGRRLRRRRSRRSREAKRGGFRVMTNTTFFNTDTPQTSSSVLDYLNDELEVDNMQISPAYAYEKAPDQEHWLGVDRDPGAVPQGVRRRAAQAVAAQPLADLPRLPRGQGAICACTAWAIPSYSLLGWQRPCYLLDDGYAETYQELIDETDWDAFGRGKDPRCANCMAHCGYEPTAVLATMKSLKDSLHALRSTT